MLQWETAWRARGHESILQTYIHPDLIPYLRHSVTHPALPFLRDHIIRMEAIPWKVTRSSSLVRALVSFELIEFGNISRKFAINCWIVHWYTVSSDTYGKSRRNFMRGNGA